MIKAHEALILEAMDCFDRIRSWRQSPVEYCINQITKGHRTDEDNEFLASQIRTEVNWVKHRNQVGAPA